ncbi:MAG: 50S ribosomal protein L19e [Candidatus Aenigmatarchaeota archaeon]
MNLSTQKRMAADVLKCGEKKVWIDPDRQEDVADAITKTDIRRFIQQGAIKKKKTNGQSKSRARKNLKQKAKGRRKGHGSRKGSKGSRQKKKEEWVSRIRAQRKMLKELRDNNKLSSTVYRNLYNKAKGGFFNSKKQLKNYIERENLLEEGEQLE